MRWFRFFALGLVVSFSACSLLERGAPAQPQPPAPVLVPASPTLLGGQWTAFAIDGLVEAVAPKPVLRWIRPDRVEGSAGCIGFSAQASPQGANLRFSNLLPVGKPCLTLPGGQEDKFFKALERARSSRFEGDAQLVLLDEDGRVVARFTRSP